MRKIISLGLVSLMLVSALASCAPAADRLDPAITVASSDAQAKAEWLDGRLEEIPDDVVVGIGSNEKYGVDMSDFEEDGYIMRSIGGDVLLFGASEDGLDRAVRAYVKAAEHGATANLDETYHEGYRIKELTIAGNDISEYAVVYNGELKESLGAEVSRLVKIATGVDIPYGTYDAKPKAEHYFYLDLVVDETLKETGCRYAVKDGDVYIEGQYELGVANGVYLFFQDQCGWEDLIYGNSELQSADLVEVPADAADEYIMMFDYFAPYDYVSFNPNPSELGVFYEAFDNERHVDYIYYGRVRHACHGITAWVSESNPASYHQPCYTKENNIYEAFDRILAYVQNCESVGMKIGKDILFIDLAQLDCFGYCTCTQCMKNFRDEGKAHSGSVVRFANTIAEMMAEEGKGGIKYGIFAYHGSNPPCKTAPHEDVNVTFCTDGHCSIHPIDSGECFTPSFDMAGYLEQKEFNNVDYAEWIRGWCELSDSIYVWYYTLDNNMHQYTAIDQLYHDYKFFNECGVKGVFWQMPFCGQGVAHIQQQLGSALNRNPDMSEEEYYIEVDRLLEKTYGDGWFYIKEYINLWEEAELRRGACANCWNYGSTNFGSNYNREYYCENWEQMINLIENAREMANTAKQEKYCELLSVSPLYMGCAYNYFEAYDTENDGMLTLLEERYDLMISRMKENGLNPAGFNGVDLMQISIAEDIHEQAWMSWYDDRVNYVSGNNEERPMPQEWADHIADLATATTVVE